MGNINPALTDLKDIHLPQALAWWDMALGWWLLLLLGVLLLAASAYYASVIVAFYQTKKTKQALLQAVNDELSNIQQAYQSHQDDALFLASISTYLRRVCLSLFPQHNTAGLIQDAWLSFLDAQWGENKPKVSFLDKNIAHLLKNGAYQASFTAQEQRHIEKLLCLTKTWARRVVQHHV